MTREDQNREIIELAHQAEELAKEMRDVAAHLRSQVLYQRVRFWAILMALMASSLGVMFLVGGEARIGASAYYLIALVGHTIWGIAFVLSGALTLLCAWRWRTCLRWALLIEAIPYVGLSISFVLASWRFPDANLTAGPIYMWIAVFHAFLSDFARREFG